MEQIAGSPKTISGKQATIGLLSVLLLTGGLFYWVTIAYSQYNASRRQTELTWRELAGGLDLRYRQLDTRIASLVDSRELDMRLGERWRSSRTAFSGTTLYLNQVAAAQSLEDLLSEMPENVQRLSGNQTVEALAESYGRAAAEQRERGRTQGSQLLKTMLNLPDPIELRLHRPGA